MKKIIKLRESDLINIVKRVLSESTDKENTINYLLDKINRYGKDSLSDDEMDMLKNPDSIEHSLEDESSDEIHDMVKTLQTLGLVNPKFVNFYEDYIEVYNIEGGDFEYFSDYDGFLRIIPWDPMEEDDYPTMIMVNFEDDLDVEDDLYGDNEDGMIAKEEVFNYIDNKWADELAKKDIGLVF